MIGEKIPLTEVSSPAARTAHSRLGRSAGLRGFIVKLALMAAVNAFGLYGILASWAVANWAILSFLVIALILANVVYFVPGRRLIPFKYLAPGLTFLLIFQIFVIFFTAGVAFTNYGDGHNASKEAAVQTLLANSETRVENSPDYRIAVMRTDEGSLAFAGVQEGSPLQFIGTEESGLQFLADLTGDPGTWQLPGYTVLSPAEILAAQEEIVQLRIPVPGSDAALRTNDGSWAYEYLPGLRYDASSDVMTARDGTEYRPTAEGNFASADGQQLTPGWQVNVGWANFAAIFDPKILGGPFVSVTLWTFAFAILSVFITFFAGLFLALLFNKPSMKGRNIYRALLFLPYAFPVFLSVLVWAGLLNRDFGFINEVLLGGAPIPWLTDPVLAKVSVLIVNLWLGFPYMFLICMGALQSIPSDLYESARLDGAGPWGSFRRITLPLLLVAVGPLLIASFAMNFNNFNIIYLLTNGGPRDLSSDTGVGATDILITLVYKIAFESGASQYGLASAISILIFIMVAVVSLLTFRRSKALEDISS